VLVDADWVEPRRRLASELVPAPEHRREHERPLVHLVFPKALSRRNLQRDRTSVIGGSENPRRMRSKVKAPDVPTVHDAAFSFREPLHTDESFS
jgi:hypothetical protein